MNSNDLKITATLDADPASRAVFTWNFDGDEPTCGFVAIGAADDALEALLAADVHEGKDLAGWTVTIS